MEKKKNNKIGWIILLLFLLYCSASGNYLSSGDEYLSENASWLALIDLGICTFAMMIIPFVWRLINGKKFDSKKGKNICKWNSIILFILSIILMASINISFIGGLGAIMYYFINKWLFVDEEDIGLSKEPITSKKTFKCSECGAICYEGDRYCKNCKAIFDEDDSDEEVKEYRCDNCGYEFNRNFSKCPNCKLPFDGEINSKTKIVEEENAEGDYTCDNCGATVKEEDTVCPKCGFSFVESSEEESEKDEEKYTSVCSNCGAKVKDSYKKCPNCGEKFDEEEDNKKSTNSKTDMDSKYSDLKKLKKLLDDNIITQEEFEKEKKKILG